MTGGARPSVDVGVVTWNTADLTVAALRRLLETDQGCELRLLVRDNSSSDGTVEAIRRAVPQAEIEVGAENLGFARGMNRLIARSEAPWFLLLNSDAWPEPGAIGRLVEAAEGHPRAAAVAPKLLRPDGSLEHSTLPFPSLRLAIVMALLRPALPRRVAENMLLEGAWRHDRVRRVDWAVGAALLVRRNALEEIGPLDESFFMYVEDLEWCWRARRKGWEIWFEPAAVVRHVGNVSGAIRFGERRTETYLANTYRFYAREHGAAAAGAYRAFSGLGVSLRYLAARVRGDRGKTSYWRAQRAAHRGASRSSAPS